MELRVSEITLPDRISFNYEELKAELQEKVKTYETLVYTDDQIKSAKSDRANLNKLKKALNDERIRREKEYMQPFNDFKQKINEIIGIIDKPVSLIDRQVKEYEFKKQQEKQMAIEELFSSIGFQKFVHIDMIMDPKWLNASVSMAEIERQMKERLYQIGNDVMTLNQLPEFGFEATEVYKSTLDINKALAEGQRMVQIAKAKAEREAVEQARIAEETEAKNHKEFVPPVADDTYFEQCVKQWISFQALLSTEDALALKNFFNDRQIEFKAV